MAKFTIRGGNFSTGKDRVIKQAPVEEVIDVFNAPEMDDIYNINAARKQQLNKERLDAAKNLASPLSSQINQNQSMVPMTQSTYVSAPELADRYNKSLWSSGTPIKEMIINRANRSGISPEVVTMARGMLGDYDPGSAGDELGSATPIYNPYQQLLDSFTGQEDFGGTTGEQPPAFLDDRYSFPQGIASALMKSNYMAPLGDLGKMDERYMAAESHPLAQYTNPIVDAIAGMQTNPVTGEKFDMTNPDARYAFYNLTQETKKDSEAAAVARKRDQDREMARLAALAQQQQQQVVPCPDGYRLDPTTNTCVPTDDTTDTAPGTGGTYEPLIKPVESYTQASPYTVPVINLPDIFG